MMDRRSARRSFSLACAPAGLLLITTPAAGAAGRSPWQLNAAALAGTPAALDQGLCLGAAAEVQRRLGDAPAFFSARLGWMEGSVANRSWVIDHHQFLLAAAAGAGKSVGAGRLWAQAGGGAGGIYELLSRHQRQRIDAAGVPGGVERSFALGLYGFAELGIAVRLRGGAAGFLAGGPTLTRATVEDRPVWRIGAGTRLGVAYDF